MVTTSSAMWSVRVAQRVYEVRPAREERASSFGGWLSSLHVLVLALQRSACLFHTATHIHYMIIYLLHLCPQLLASPSTPVR